jgi:hypothetical protein
VKLKSISLLAALSVAAVAAQAKTVGLGTLGEVTVNGGGVALSFGEVINDNFTFSLSTDSTVQSNVTTFLGNINPAFYGIYTAGLDGVVGNGDDVQLFAYGFSSVSTGNFSVLAAGNYHFKVFGLSSADVSGYAISASAVAQPVPEPETYALLAAGLGVIGFVARRRRNG